ncbi:polysaccharide deacetylase 2 family uncharacterized protein YibQ [Hydrogenispora ethanolica]|uniref:Polysaccharide deacetylase 2 family uncharacterized protein YibQ n=1 Tax=Hydrogenispora ethanolica TaxID=1082276 RepID=A0A4R1QR20_HYDET|nr:divergent polysaccharide deacetylase family protein [Hydrogenispora ethanolica]TCL55363.1 polysaccharide deacetylase 2 family uncharacterized protein YibQ [Hydrogenispora ethanolica]
MRPLSSAAKTAFIFYAVFAVFLLMVDHWIPGIVPAAAPAAAPGQELVFERPGTVDLVFLQDSLDESWGHWLSSRGWRPGDLIRGQEAQLMTREYPRNRLRWVKSRTRLELPAVAEREELVDMAWEWRNLVTSQGLFIRRTDWGVNRGNVWVRLESEARIRLSGKALRLPMAELLISQRLSPGKPLVWNWRGLIPEPHPKLPPAPPPIASQPEPPPQPQSPPPPRPTAAPVRPELPAVQYRAKVALIIDDVGFVRGPADAMLQVPASLTWSVLPFTPYAAEYIEAARERGFEIMLHLPLEPLNAAHNNPGPGLIKAEWPEEQIIRQLDADLAQVPGAVGLNNHMGSAGTHDDRLMEILMKALKERGIFFVDSNTGDGAHPSVAGKYAREYRVPYAKRRIFIDNSSDPESKKNALRQLMALALAEGEAIGIGHVREGTAEAIRAVLPEFAEAGVRIVPVSELVQ